MNARTLSPERTRELDALRRRAYGPDADIAADPAALARLRELEDLLLAGAPQTDDEVPEPAAPDSPEPKSPLAESPGEPDEERGDAACDLPDDAVPARWWKRIPVWSIVAFALVAGIGVGVASISTTMPRADVVLRPAVAQGDRDAAWQRELQSWGISSDSATEYDDYNGVGVWTASSDDGSRCIVLENGERPVSATCIGAGFDPILDLTMYGGMDDVFDVAPPIGSVIRFIARDDTVEVWVGERQSVDASWIDVTPSAL